MGNSTSLNENISKLENLDISKSITKNLSSKCAACSISLNIISFKRKKCRNCIEYYCQNCLKQFKENIFICYRCVIFISPEFSWSGLMELKTKDLKWFLIKHHIDCTGSKEKEQLVELIMERFSSPDDQQKRENHRKLLLSNMENLYDLEHQTNNNTNIPIYDRRANQSNLLDNSPGTSNTIQPNYSVNEQQNQSPTTSVSSKDGSLPTENEETTPDLPPPQYEEIEDINKLSDHSTSINHNSATTMNSNNNNSSPDTHRLSENNTIDANKPIDRNQRVYIENISQSNEIDDLSVKQLKDLLAYNKMDYKGCVEKHELITRVQRLWTDCQLSNSKFTSNRQSAISARECIICMDHVIDGVLLECGHMISCVRCGSQLAECPICRQNVVRVKRVFSAH